MNIHVMVEYSGFSCPNLMWPYLLNANHRQKTTDNKVKIKTGVVNTRVTHPIMVAASAIDSVE